MPVGVGLYDFAVEFGICWADGKKKNSRCLENSISELGLCLVCYYHIVGRPPNGYTDKDVEVEIRSRKDLLIVIQVKVVAQTPSQTQLQE